MIIVAVAAAFAASLIGLLLLGIAVVLLGRQNSPSRSLPGSFLSGTTSARSLSTGCPTFDRRSYGASTIRCSQRRKSWSETVAISRHRVSPANIGAAPVPSERYSRRRWPASRLPYFNPHSFRKTLALLGGQICKSPEQYKAWSQNLGHENVLTTFSSYGDVARHRQAEIIRALGKSEQPGAV